MVCLLCLTLAAGSVHYGKWRVLRPCSQPCYIARHLLNPSASYYAHPNATLVHAAPLEVWAFGLPGELCSPDVSAAIAASCRLTSVAVGVDAAPRTTGASLAALLDQAVVGLARLR